jgi:7-carboxy-7-deazaguanine synthase
MEPQEIIAVIGKALEGIEYQPALVVISGGEPFRQNLSKLVNRLLELGLRVQIETNGTLWQELPYDHENLMIVCSPKTGAVNVNLEKVITAYKYVIQNGQVDPEDGLPLVALNHPNNGRVAKPREGALVYVQPADEGSSYANHVNMEETINSAMTHGHIFCLQVHKVIGVK